MTRKEVMERGGMELYGHRAIPYGTEFAFVREASGSRGPWTISFASASVGGHEVEGCGENLLGRRFVVTTPCKKIDGRYCFMAIPAESLDKVAQEIEDSIVERLLRGRFRAQ